MKVFLIPNIISKNTETQVIPSQVKTCLDSIDVFFVENVRTARRYISAITKLPGGSNRRIDEITFEIVDKTSTSQSVAALFERYQKKDIGVLSESGCPGIADPGSLVVQHAHRHNIRVVPLTGPSSILMALMASGMNGQNFSFHGYLPIEKKALEQEILKIEKRARSGETHIFIETPYRNQQLIEVLLRVCQAETRLCIAVDITGEEESIATHSIDQWRKAPPQLPKAPVVFLIN